VTPINTGDGAKNPANNDGQTGDGAKNTANNDGRTNKHNRGNLLVNLNAIKVRVNV